MTQKTTLDKMIDNLRHDIRADFGLCAPRYEPKTESHLTVRLTAKPVVDETGITLYAERVAFGMSRDYAELTYKDNPGTVYHTSDLGMDDHYKTLTPEACQRELDELKPGDWLYLQDVTPARAPDQYKPTEFHFWRIRYWLAAEDTGERGTK